MCAFSPDPPPPPPPPAPPKQVARMKNPLALRPEDNAENLGARRGSNGLASLRIGRQENSANGLGGL